MQTPQGPHLPSRNTTISWRASYPTSSERLLQYLLFKLSFHCGAARYLSTCDLWESLTWAPVWMGHPGQPWTLTSYTTDRTHAVACSGSSHMHTLAGQSTSALSYLLFARFQTPIPSPDSSGLRLRYRAIFMPPFPPPGCS